jgi:hypothetical protein
LLRKLDQLCSENSSASGPPLSRALWVAKRNPAKLFPLHLNRMHMRPAPCDEPAWGRGARNSTSPASRGAGNSSSTEGPEVGKGKGSRATFREWGPPTRESRGSKACVAFVYSVPNLTRKPSECWSGWFVRSTRRIEVIFVGQSLSNFLRYSRLPCERISGPHVWPASP